MEDNLKTFKVEYLSNPWSNLTQIWNLSLGVQIKLYKYFKWSWPLMKDDIKIFKVEYISNHCLNLTNIWNLSWGDQTKL